MTAQLVSQRPLGPSRRQRGSIARAAILVLAVVIGSVLITIVAGRSGPAAGHPWRSGGFAGYGPADDLAFGAWRGEPVTSATDFLPSDDWAQIEHPAWAIAHWRSARGVWPDFSVALWPASGGSLAEAASGAYDAHFAALARSLVAGGLGGAGIRLGWEFNGSWYRWSVRSADDAALYAAAWRRVVKAMRSVPGAKFRFDWTLSAGAGIVDPSLAYPGDAFVDDVGMDAYDWNPSGPVPTPPARWRALVTERWGLAWQARFAAAHHKPIAFPEWGLVDDTVAAGRGAGDDPVFVRSMYGWFSDHHVAFENYFDADAPAEGRLYALTADPGRFPKAAAAYRALFGQSDIGRRRWP